MLVLLIVLSGSLFALDASGSTLTRPPQSAIIVAFERAYEQSLLAYTLSDAGIDATLIVSSLGREKLYESLLDIEIITVEVAGGETLERTAIQACESLLTDRAILQRVREIQPTFLLFPALRHDACLLPWSESIGSIPIVVTHDPAEELYAVQRTRLALPVHTGGIWSGFWACAASRSVTANADANYVGPVSKLVRERLDDPSGFPAGGSAHQPQQRRDIDFEKLYETRVQLVLTTGDPILRTNYASLGSQPVQIGCHHCRGAHPLPADLQKQLVEYRLGTIVVTLDESYATLVEHVARKLPQGRQGQAVAWKNRKLAGVAVPSSRPENLVIHGDVDRQDLIGYARARVSLSHCEEGELLESAFHGTPVICVPRDSREEENARRAAALGFSVSTTSRDPEDVVGAVERVHGTASYRETARAISVLMRDRELPASDRLLHWLGFVARNRERLVGPPAPLRSDEIRTFPEDSQLFAGFLLGAFVGATLALLAVSAAWFGSRSARERERAPKNSKFTR